MFQPVARELIWAAMFNSPGAMASYSEHSRLPLPAPAEASVAMAPLLLKPLFATGKVKRDGVAELVDDSPGGSSAAPCAWCSSTKPAPVCRNAAPLRRVIASRRSAISSGLAW